MRTEWIPFSGHDSEGDQFNDLCLVGVDGRIMALVKLPNAGEYSFDCYFYLPWCYESDVVRFIALEPAKEFCLERVTKALTKIARKRPRGKRIKSTDQRPSASEEGA